MDTVTLVNLVSETRAVPEFIGKDCKADGHRACLAVQILDAKSARSGACHANHDGHALGQRGSGVALIARRARCCEVLRSLSRG